jgi:hypothetical protein
VRIFKTLALWATVIGLGGPGFAQSLGELAAKEKQKRQGKPAPKVITEADLGRAGRGTLSVTGETPAEGAEAGAVDTASAVEGTATEGPEAAAPGSPAAPGAAKPNAKPEKTEDELAAERRAAWQKKLDLARQKVSVHQGNVDNIQRDLNDVTGGVFTERRTQVLKMLDDEKAKLAAAQAELQALDDEGRRNGWPR